MEQTETKRILVMGVGNILWSDEGLGVRTVEWLEKNYDFSGNVSLFDGGTLGMRLMEPIMESDLLIVVDAVLGDGDPGSIYRLTGDDLRKSLAFKNSMHQTDLVDTLIYCDIAGHRPEAVVIGVEPYDFQTMAVEVSPCIAERMPEIAKVVLEEISRAGGGYTAKA
ncbi:hydrogenase expression/formation protein [Desulfovibrio sp. X2]|uniref:HyaD/HybD family hydrogenase maturation endopeptidase n=1 Tax=Desulfovibrio sp. X2 TaxID=941449 RepID=UPI000358D089|nr:HyaD/HybD family hydrogenase maturation endopeptidase [Desulfovibrio sp. X2]EPR42216.1 hydrogenase expression/formation protein [Desulfovibrio sp. X2]